jgi:hypothetical protein
MRLLILGWKPGFAELLPRLGVEFVVLVGLDEVREYGLPDVPDGRVIKVRDICDTARALPALARHGLGPSSFDVVHTDHEFAIIPAALLASHLGARGMPVDTALMARDKWLQKQAVAMAGLPVPPFDLVPDDPSESDRILAQASYPALLKPISSASGRHTDQVRCPEEARLALAAVDVDAVDTDAFIIEGLVNGQELHLDGVVHAGLVEFVSVGRYRRNVLDARLDATVGSLILDPRRHETVYSRAYAFAQRALEAMRLRDAAFHLEVFDTGGDEFIFSECGARTGGSFIVRVVQAKFGVDLRQAGLNVAIGRRPFRSVDPADTAVGWTYLPAPLGRILHVPSSDEVLRRQGVREAQTAVGQEFPIQHGLVGNSQKAGLALLEAPSEAELEARIQAVVAWFRSACKTDPTVSAPAATAGYVRATT